ncbi:MAG TPA: hypothetical protein VGL42_11495 [Opitutaceae bacterium]|jgi:hypothetical protein
MKWSLLVALVGLLAGCAEEQWPRPQKTTDIVLDSEHHAALATMGLGDALRVLLPPPPSPNLQWVVIVINGRVLRQMYGMGPSTERPGWSEISFQSIHTVVRTELKFAAVPVNAQGYEPKDMFVIGIAVKHRGELKQ